MTSPRPMRPRRALPFGGAAEVARSYLAVHVRNPWTGRCRSCGCPYPCQDRTDAETVAGRPEPTPRRLWLLAIPALLGLVLVAAVTSGLIR